MKILLILVVSIFNLTFLLLKEPLSGDGLFSAALTRLPWSEMWNYIVADFHPPLYYLLLRLTTKAFGFTDLAVKSLSVILGLLTILLLYELGKVYFSQESGFWGSLILAFLPLHLFVSRDARMYPLLTFLTVLTFYLYHFVLERKNLFYQLGLGVTLTLSLYTHNWGILLWGYIFLFFLIHKKIRYGFLPLVMSFLAFTPWIPIFLDQLITKSFLGRSWGLPINNFWPRLWGGMLFNYNLLHLPSVYWWASALISFLAVLFLFIPGSTKKRFLMISLFLPFNLILFYLLTYREPFLTFPYLSFLVPFYALGLGRGISLIINKPLKYSVVGMLLLTLLSFNVAYHYYANSSGAREAQLYVKTHLEPGEKVIVLTPYEALRMSWYSELSVDSFIVLSPKELSSFVLKGKDLKTALNKLKELKEDRCWVFYSGVDRYRKDKASIYDPQAIIKHWLKTNSQMELPFGETTSYPVWVFKIN